MVSYNQFCHKSVHLNDWHKASTTVQNTITGYSRNRWGPKLLMFMHGAAHGHIWIPSHVCIHQKCTPGKSDNFNVSTNAVKGTINYVMLPPADNCEAGRKNPFRFYHLDRNMCCLHVSRGCQTFTLPNILGTILLVWPWEVRWSFFKFLRMRWYATFVTNRSTQIVRSKVGDRVGVGNWY